MDKINILKQEELKILDYVTEICEKNNLKYFLDFGTLIGAIRHEGFIPWDDDIDISMPYDDYCKFIKICTQMNDNSDFFIQTSETDIEYYQFFAKMRKKNTTFLEKDAKFLNYNKGIYIDIFPLESTSKIGIIFKIKLVLAVTLNKICVFIKNPFPFIPFTLAKFIRKIFYPVKAKYINKIIRCLLKNSKEKNYFFCLDNGFNFDAIFKKYILSNYKNNKFEGKDYKIPSEYNIYLSKIYGNYMELPPKNMRINPHCALIIDNKRGYEYYEEK